MTSEDEGTMKEMATDPTDVKGEVEKELVDAEPV